MTLPDPKFAPRRGDLPWLRRRRKPAAIAAQAPPPAPTAPRPAVGSRPAAPPAAAAPPHPGGGRIDYTRRDRATPTPAPTRTPEPAPRPVPPPRPVPRPPATPTPAPAASSGNPLDLSGPAPAPAPPPNPAPAPTPPRTRPAPSSQPASGDPLDLSAPTPDPAAPPTPAPAPAAGGSTSLDLGGPPASPPAPAAPAASTSLDLGAPPATPPAPTSAPPPAPAAARHPAPEPPRPEPPRAERHHVVRRTRSGATTLLDFGAPVVTLDRLQSGVGGLTIDAVVGGEVGDLRIGAAYALTDGRTGTVELDADRRHGPDTRRPVVWAQKEGRFERIAVDLRQTRSLARLLVYGFSPSRASLTWGGTMVVTTYGADRIDAPIVSPPSPAVLALVSIYPVDGEFVLRAEMDPVAGSVRDTCRAFGYDRITWLDDRTPVT